jgi:hypothetical protein
MRGEKMQKHLALLNVSCKNAVEQSKISDIDCKPATESDNEIILSAQHRQPM